MPGEECIFKGVHSVWINWNTSRFLVCNFSLNSEHITAGWVESEYSLSPTSEWGIEVITWTSAAAGGGGKGGRGDLLRELNCLISVRVRILFFAPGPPKQATTFAAEITSICILYAANTGGNLLKIEFTFRLPKSNSSVASNYIVWHVAGIDLISVLDKKYVYEKYKRVKRSTAVSPESLPSFSLDLLLIAAGDSDGLRLRPSDGLPLRLSGGSLAEAKLFDFRGLVRDQVTPCWPLGWQGIQIKSGRCRIPNTVRKMWFSVQQLGLKKKQKTKTIKHKSESLLLIPHALFSWKFNKFSQDCFHILIIDKSNTI